MTTATQTILEYRSNNAYDTILVVSDGIVAGASVVTPVLFAEFSKGGFDAADWQGYTADGPANDYGDLLATYDGTLTVVDDRQWDGRVEFYA